ncbi:MAG: Gfo/Idh/MocA family oxidoreductase [Eubacteriales bacterium]
MSDHIKNILLVGTGAMAVAYCKVLKDMENVKFTVVGRSESKCEIFQKETTVSPISGGVMGFLRQSQEKYDYAINAVNIEDLQSVTKSLMEYGIKNILIEKPAFLNYVDADELEELNRIYKCNLYVAYNRRFYASVIAGKKMIEEDGGITSIEFSFTEWVKALANMGLSQAKLNKLFFGNSTHVIDLAFYLAGEPEQMYCIVDGKNTIEWHPQGSIFVGCGVTNKNAIFSYHADWNAPGRWWVEVNTNVHKFIYRPLEKLQIQEQNSVQANFVDIDYTLDEKYKPGLYLEVETFLNKSQKDDLVSLQVFSELCKIYERIEKG